MTTLAYCSSWRWYLSSGTCRRNLSNVRTNQKLCIWLLKLKGEIDAVCAVLNTAHYLQTEDMPSKYFRKSSGATELPVTFDVNVESDIEKLHYPWPRRTPNTRMRNGKTCRHNCSQAARISLQWRAGKFFEENSCLCIVGGSRVWATTPCFSQITEMCRQQYCRCLRSGLIVGRMKWTKGITKTHRDLDCSWVL